MSRLADFRPAYVSPSLRSGMKLSTCSRCAVMPNEANPASNRPFWMPGRTASKLVGV